MTTALSAAEAALAKMDPDGTVWTPAPGSSPPPPTPVVAPPPAPPKPSGAGSGGTKPKRLGSMLRTAGAIARPNGEMYYPRALGDHSDVNALRECHKHRLPFLLQGPPGTGKTALIEAVFADGFEMVLGTGDTEVADFLGNWIPDGKGGYRYDPGPVPRAFARNVPLYVDEAFLIDPKVCSVLYPLMDGRNIIQLTDPETGRSYMATAPPKFMVAMSANPDVPGANPSDALLSRLPLQIEVQTDFDLARSLKIPAKAIKVAENLKTKRDKKEIAKSPQLRELIDFKRIADIFGMEVAINNLIGTSNVDDRDVMIVAVKNAFGSDAAAAGVLRLGPQV